MGGPHAPDTVGALIPRVCHMVWLGGQLPPHLADLVDTFTAHHPHWQLRWWHETDIDRLPMAAEVRDIYERAPEIVVADSVYQMRSDIARYAILHAHGGMYADCDYRWQASIDPYLEGHSLVCGWELQNRWVATGMIASAPGHPAMAEALAGIPHRVATRNPVWRSNRLTGPHLWTPIARRHAHILRQQILHPAPWTNPAAADRRWPRAVAVHVWNHQREIRGLWPNQERSLA